MLDSDIDYNDILHKTFGLLTVDECIGKRLKFRGGFDYVYKCHCECGNSDVFVRRKHLLDKTMVSCGCTFDKSVFNLTCVTFSRLSVKGRSITHYSSSGKTRMTLWMCKCECGNFVEVNSVALRKGRTTSCGCYQKDRVSELLTDDLTDREFGLLTVKYRNGSWRPKNGKLAGIRAVWHCVCKCGGECDAVGELLKNGDIVSCGCSHTSKYELYVKMYLDNHGYIENVDYFRQKSYPDLLGVGNGHLLYDFLFVTSNGCSVLIECQGEQHYKAVKWFGGNEYYEKLKEHDKRKKDYAFSHDFMLIEVPYTIVSYDKMSEFLDSYQIF